MNWLKAIQRVERAVHWMLAEVLDVVIEGRTWKNILYSPSYRPDYVARLHGALRAEGVRSKYQVVGTGMISLYAGGIASAQQTIKLLVHRDDFPRARRIMDRFQDR